MMKLKEQVVYSEKYDKYFYSECEVEEFIEEDKISQAELDLYETKECQLKDEIDIVGYLEDKICDLGLEEYIDGFSFDYFSDKIKTMVSDVEREVSKEFRPFHSPTQIKHESTQKTYKNQE